jgi:hypothetical protein
MLQPHHSKLSPLQQVLPTGNNFGGSNLNTLPSKRFIDGEIWSSFVLFIRGLGSLSIQILSLILVTIWFWCVLAAVRIALGWEKKIDPITAQKPERVPFMGTLSGS